MCKKLAIDQGIVGLGIKALGDGIEGVFMAVIAVLIMANIADSVKADLDLLGELQLGDSASLAELGCNVGAVGCSHGSAAASHKCTAWACERQGLTEPSQCWGYRILRSESL